MDLIGSGILIPMLLTFKICYAPLLWATEHVMMSHVDKLIYCQLYGQKAVCRQLPKHVGCSTMYCGHSCWLLVWCMLHCMLPFLCFVCCGRQDAKQFTKATIMSCMVYSSCMTLSHVGHWVQSGARLGGRTPLLKHQVCLACSHTCLLCVMDAN